MGGCLEKFDGSAAKKRSKPEIQLLTNENVENQKENEREPTDQQTKLTALYDYESRNSGDLSFKKEDEFILITTEEDWLLVKSTKSDLQGYVPSNYVAESGTVYCEDWFFGTITRKDSERLLLRLENEKGNYLVRESETSQTSFSLSILNDDATKGLYVKHYRIHSSEGRTFYITEGLEFGDLKELVKYYKGDPHGLCCQLGKCCAVKEVPQTLSLARNVRIIHESLIEKGEILNNYSAGDAYRAIWNGTTQVVIKGFKFPNLAEKELPPDMQDLRKLHHKRLVKFFGVVYPQPIFFVWESTCFGNLLQYLRNGEGKDSTITDQIDIAAQVASGMAYLETKNIIHNQLCAANVMVDKGPVFKVTDYGLAQYSKESTVESQKFALWTAPEVHIHSKSSIKSDVWSFGITTTEIVTKGGTPYANEWGGVSEVLPKIEEGKRMNKPEECPDALYEILLQCWDKDSELRPTFEYLQIFLENFFAND